MPLTILERAHRVQKPGSYQTYRVPTTARCCRTAFALDGFTNTCPDCGQDYNSAGQALTSRQTWGEETGEHWADVVRIP